MKGHESIPEQAYGEVKKSLSAGTMVVGTATKVARDTLLSSATVGKKAGLGRRLLIRMARRRGRFISSLAAQLLGLEEIHPK